MKSRNDRYGGVAVTIHWLSAVAVFVAVGSGFAAAMAVDSADKARLLQLHVPMATAVLVLTVVRIAWWRLMDCKPGPVLGVPRWQERSARAVHALLYIILFLMLGSGIALLVVSGAGNALFGGYGTLPDFTQFAPRTAHGVGALLIVLLIAAHVGAALYHQFVRRDSILRRMWYARSG
ncbi:MULTISPECIES: cytochrome b [Alphaproteobacteria]|jgi:cytochrome b561|uniref:Cytochrome b561 n=1 Tax=Gellertiella hungarica TaxID=1572859 RepID=A0A7W6J7Q3_9HYPH|nr:MULTISPECIES: cytochrome b [Alphaproteobacteria]KRW97483.1 cytochrome B [Paracoccus sp. MKU1]MBB4066345.1 cytochrome b561 [Gellertiella hungarica]